MCRGGGVCVSVKSERSGEVEPAHMRLWETQLHLPVPSKETLFTPKWQEASPGSSDRQHARKNHTAVCLYPTGLQLRM